MASGQCSYDCSKNPTEVSPYSDISGIGVVLGYVITAGIAVFIITAYYFISYRPDVDPFERPRETDKLGNLVPFRPNPIDIIVLKACRWLWKGVTPKGKKALRLQDALEKCILNMSDLQIVTGISILISGFAQLRCGLSAYHWQIMVWLAWFSSLTNMSCLTLLRRYLYTHPAERFWRLVGMLAIAGMLIAAMLPTYSYSFPLYLVDEDNKIIHPTPSDQAICYYRPKHSGAFKAGKRAAGSMVVLIVGFGYRAVRLHKAVSVGMLGRIRLALRSFALQKLDQMYKWCDVENSPHSLKRTLLYWPILGIRLNFKVIWDFLTSMYFEVLFLCYSFGWGVYQMVAVRNVANGGNSDWGFGQVISVVVLAAPFVAFAGLLFPDPGRKIPNAEPLEDQTSPAADDTKDQLPTVNPEAKKSTAVNATVIPFHDDGIDDDPKRDYYKKTTFATATLLLPLILATIAVSTVNTTITWRIVVFNTLLTPIYFTTFIITSFWMESFSHKLPAGRYVFKLVPFLAFSPYLLQIVPQVVLWAFGFAVILTAPIVGLYVIWCFIYWGWFEVRLALIRRRSAKAVEPKQNTSISTGSSDEITST